MLAQTEKELDDLTKKISLLSGVIGNLGDIHKECDKEVSVLHKRASIHKLKLLENVLKLAGSKPIDTVITP